MAASRVWFNLVRSSCKQVNSRNKNLTTILAPAFLSNRNSGKPLVSVRMASEYTDLVKHCRKIIGLAKNFKVAGADPSTFPTEPILFLKAPTTLLHECEGKPIKIPEGHGVVNYEVELGVIIGKDCSNVTEEEALEHIGGYCVTLDMTAMEKVKQAIGNGHPWVLGKCCDTFTPISAFIEKEKIADPENVNLWLKLDGELKQNGSTKDLVCGIAKQISFISNIMKLEKGDLILSGTPGGAGPCKAGQTIECGIDGVKDIKFSVA